MPHTPGPWEYDEGLLEVRAGDDTLADLMLSTKGVSEDDANGWLMAAAPQMLTALKAAWFAIDPDTHPDQNRMVREAIEAAEGAGK